MWMGSYISSTINEQIPLLRVKISVEEEEEALPMVFGLVVLLFSQSCLPSARTFVVLVNYYVFQIVTN